MQFLNLFTRFFVLFLFTLFLSTPFTFAAPLQHPRGRKGPDARLPGNLFSITQDCHTGERHPELSHCPDIGAYYFREDVSTTCPFMPKAMISSLDIGADGAFMALALLNNHGRGLKFPLLLFKQLFGTIDTLKVMEVYARLKGLEYISRSPTSTPSNSTIEVTCDFSLTNWPPLNANVFASEYTERCGPGGIYQAVLHPAGTSFFPNHPSEASSALLQVCHRAISQFHSLSSGGPETDHRHDVLNDYDMAPMVKRINSNAWFHDSEIGKKYPYLLDRLHQHPGLTGLLFDWYFQSFEHMALHELMHTDWGLSAVDSPLEGGTMGRAYHWDGCEQLAREAPEKAVENADSLAMWAMLSSIMMQRWPVNEKTLNMGYV